MKTIIASAFIVRPTTKKGFCFKLRDEYSVVILRSKEIFSKLEDCLETIECIRVQAKKKSNFSVYVNASGKFTFRVTDSENASLGFGNPFSSMEARDKGIDAVQECVASASLISTLV